MQEKESVTSRFIKDPAHFADLVNGFIFEGQQFLEAADVQIPPERFSRVDKAEKNTKAKPIILDMVKRVCRGILVTVIHIQDISELQYSMPIRVISEDASYYNQEWRGVKVRHREERDVFGAEYAAGFLKGEKIMASVTIVVYWGQKEWDGPTRLKDMMPLEGYPKTLRRRIVDYPIHLLEVRKYEYLDQFQSDIKQVFGFLQRDEDAVALNAYVQENSEVFSNLSEAAYTVISKMSHCKALDKEKENHRNIDGGYNMSKAIYSMMENSKQEGRRQGKREGEWNAKREMCRRVLILLLAKRGEISEDVRNRIVQEENPDVLECWVFQAMNAENMEEFERKIKS